MTDESEPVDFSVIPPPVSLSPLSVSVTSPENNVMYYAPVDFVVKAQVSNEVPPGPDYLKVVNNQSGFRKLKLGYSTNNLYGSPQNVIADGNDSLIIVMKDFTGNADFTSIIIKPSGIGTITLAPFISNAMDMGNGWKKLSIPLSVFDPSIDFSQISMFEFPYSANAGNFELGFSLIKFVGAATPFVWFGEGKTNNIHDGFNGPGQLLASVIFGSVGIVQATRVDFFDGAVKIGEDFTKPYSVNYNNIQGGLHKFTATVFDNNGLENHSDTTTVLVQPSLPPSALVLTVTFAEVPTVLDIQKAPLRYNKKFAYSLTLDDGLRDAYTCAFPLLNGGYVAGNNTTYPGLFYTDGCGNDLKFKSGSAWYSLGGSMNDLHINSTNYLNWNELQNMLTAGWNVYNHSLQHAAGPGTDYDYQILENTKYIRNKTGYTTRHFMVPSGDQGYVEPAFANGMVAVYANNGGYSGYPNGLNVKDPLNYGSFKMFRRFLYDDYYNPSNICQHIDNAANLSTNGNYYWYNDFTHRVDFQTYGGSLVFPTFEFYMNHIANTYGKNGSDCIWVAPLQEVFEYLQVRDLSVLSTSLSGNQLQIAIDRSFLPDSLLRYALSFVISSDADIVSVVANQPATITFKGHPVYAGLNPPPPPEAHQDISTKLINLEWESNLLKSGENNNGRSEVVDSEERSAFSDIVLSPNPASEVLTISFNDLTAGLLEIIHPTAGKVINMDVISRKVVEVNVASLSAGLYVVRYTSADKTVRVSKFIKK